MKPLGKVKLQWSPDIAYAVGLIASDGNLSPDGRHLNFTSKDKELAELFRKCLGLKNKIGRKARAHEKVKKYYVVQFGDVLFYRWLVEIGLMPNKSKQLEALNIPDIYFGDFLRGQFDGDGNIRVYQDPVWKNSQRLYVTFCSAGQKYVEWLRSKINTLLCIKGFVRKGTRVLLLTFAKRESLILLSYLYHSPNLPWLTRKYVLAEPFVKNAEVAELSDPAPE